MINLIKKVYYKVPYLFEMKNAIQKRFCKNSALVDMSEVAPKVFALVQSIDPNIQPFFGTLLALHREGKVGMADDFDFAVTQQDKLSMQLIEEFEQRGAKLIAFSMVKNGTQLVELSFEYLNAKVDVFYLQKNTSDVVHSCPNFRKSKPQMIQHDELAIHLFPSHFEVSYPPFTTELNNSTGLYQHSNPASMFEKHYASDWMVPKQSNFIDFSNYRFIKQNAFSAYGSSKAIKAVLNTYFTNNKLNVGN